MNKGLQWPLRLCIMQDYRTHAVRWLVQLVGIGDSVGPLTENRGAIATVP